MVSDRKDASNYGYTYVQRCGDEIRDETHALEVPEVEEQSTFGKLVDKLFDGGEPLFPPVPPQPN
jgi:hypothetical protein